MLSLEVFLSGIVIFITHTIEAITGFGCAALAMPFVTSLLGMQQGVMVVTVIAWLLALYVCIRNLRDIAWRKFVFIFIDKSPLLSYNSLHAAASAAGNIRVTSPAACGLRPCSGTASVLSGGPACRPTDSPPLTRPDVVPAAVFPLPATTTRSQP